MKKDFSTIKQRVLQFIESQGIEKTKFYEELGMAASNFKGLGLNSDLGSNKITKILSLYPNLSSHWLLTGEGEMVQPADDEPYYKKRGKVKLSNGDDVPVYFGNTRGGLVYVYADDPEMEKPVGTLSAALFPNCDHAEKVTGDSMYPIIINQGIIVGKKVDKQGILYGEKYGIHTRHGLNVAKFLHPGAAKEYVKMVSYNKSVPEQEILLDDIIFCFRILYIVNPA